MPDKLLGRTGDFLQSQRPWYELPKLPAMPRLVEIRNELLKRHLPDPAPAPQGVDNAFKPWRVASEGTHGTP